MTTEDMYALAAGLGEAKNRQNVEDALTFMHEASCSIRLRGERWERGLKLHRAARWSAVNPSLPARERGLKRQRHPIGRATWPVAPRAGARIEKCELNPHHP